MKLSLIEELIIEECEKMFKGGFKNKNSSCFLEYLKTLKWREIIQKGQKVKISYLIDDDEIYIFYLSPEERGEVRLEIKKLSLPLLILEGLKGNIVIKKEKIISSISSPKLRLRELIINA